VEQARMRAVYDDVVAQRCFFGDEQLHARALGPLEGLGAQKLLPLGRGHQAVAGGVEVHIHEHAVAHAHGLALVGVGEEQVFFEAPVEEGAGRTHVAHGEGSKAIDHGQRL
nr:hypothetical protein [Tanacetum cinerariifolium]